MSILERHTREPDGMVATMSRPTYTERTAEERRHRVVLQDRRHTGLLTVSTWHQLIQWMTSWTRSAAGVRRR